MLVLESRGLKALAALRLDKLIVHTHTVKLPRTRLHLKGFDGFANSMGGWEKLASQVRAVGVSIAPGNENAIQASIDFANVIA
mmetsp:Transcript_11204/g.22047  ORF Transcript_11204/g.22047 Transcript_11204/m.22047 type:complete len:83 (-) Transcript_11204:760-1008(-)